MATPHVFCSDLSRAAKEPLFGSASHALGCVLLSYPKRLWARDALASEGLPTNLLDALTRLRDRHDVVTRLVAHEGPWEGNVEVSLFPQSRRHRSVPLSDVAELLETAAPDDGELISASVIACCTHGVRDACCARFGLELVRALRLSASGSGAEVEIREASHLGGDRFAPTVLVLPSGHMYGHLTPDDAGPLIEAVCSGASLVSRFRGSLWLDALEQLAECAAMQFAAARGWPTSLRLGAITRNDEGKDRAVLRFEAFVRRAPSVIEEALALEVRCTIQRRLVIGDCRNAERGRRGNVAIWAIEAVTEAEPGDQPG